MLTRLIERISKIRHDVRAERTLLSIQQEWNRNADQLIGEEHPLKRYALEKKMEELTDEYLRRCSEMKMGQHRRIDG